MTSFEKTWDRKDTTTMTEKFRDTVKPQGALKPRIQHAINILQAQTSRMDTYLAKLRERDNQLFQKIVAATQQHNASASKVLAAELAEIRKFEKMLSNARISLEQVQLRLTTIHDLGDAMVSIGPAVSTMKGLKASLGKFMPEADAELNGMTDTLGGLMMESLAGDSFAMTSDVNNEETDSILREAATVVEQQIGDRFPSVPTPTGPSSETSSTYE